jgi:hypothetical protein
MMMDIETVVRDMQRLYLTSDMSGRSIKFTKNESDLIQKYKDNISIYFFVPDIYNWTYFDSLDGHYGNRYFGFNIGQKEQIKLCQKAKIHHEEISYDDDYVTLEKITDAKEAVFLIDPIGDKVVWGWEHIQEYTNLIWNSSYQKYNILPKMKRMKK